MLFIINELSNKSNNVFKSKKVNKKKKVYYWLKLNDGRKGIRIIKIIVKKDF